MNTISRVTVHEEGMRELLRSREVGQLLRREAQKVRRRVRAPSRMALDVRAGVAHHGAFAQVLMEGDGALAIEFGTARTAAQAPLRRALRGIG